MAFPIRPLAAAVVVFVVAVAAYAVYQSAGTGGTVTTPVPSSFTANGRTFVFNYTAVTEAERESGLMNRDVTGSTTMLFVFPTLVSQPFWMYHTGSSLDIIWINATGEAGVVAYVQADAQPCPTLPCPDYPSAGPAPLANYVIEAKAGFAATFGIEAGTKVRFAY